MPQDLKEFPTSDELKLMPWLIIISIVGIFLRLFVPLSSDFPINDGGLFYRMILDLEGNSFLPPLTTSYNAMGLPFSYPPLGLYLSALLHKGLGFELLSIVRILPPIFACLCLIPAWKIIRVLQDNPLAQIYSFALYALSYHAYQWLIMGGGVTRAPGMFFALLAILFYLRCAQRQNILTALGCGATVGLTFLSHPNTSLFLLMSIAVLFALRHDRPKFKNCLAIASIAFIVFFPWLLSLLDRGLLSTYLQAASTSHANSSIYLRLFDVFVVGLPMVPLITNVLTLLGIVRACLVRHWLFLAWLFFLYLVPRLSSHFIMLPVALLAGLGGLTLHQFSLGILRERRDVPDQEGAGALSVKILFAGIIGLLLADSIDKTSHLASTTISPRVIAEFSALRNTPTGSKFLVLMNGNVHHHHIMEWFPAFSERQSLLSPEGIEWSDASAFYSRLKLIDESYKLISDPMHRLMPEMEKVFAAADYLLVDSESLFSDLYSKWQVNLEFEGLTLFSRIPNELNQFPVSSGVK